MKTKLILFLFGLASLNVMGQATITRKKQSTTQKTTTKKTTKKTTTKKPATSSSTTPKEKTCETCSKVISQCQYNGIHPAPEAAGYDVTFTCNVPDATLHIDSRNYGPASGVVYMKTGSHSIIVSADGFNDYVDNIEVNRDKTTFDFVMERKQEVSKETNNNDSTVNLPSSNADSNQMLAGLQKNAHKKHYFVVKGGIANLAFDGPETSVQFDLEYAYRFGKRWYLIPALSWVGGMDTGNGQVLLPVQLGYAIPLSANKSKNAIVKGGFYYGMEVAGAGYENIEQETYGISIGLDFDLNKHWMLSFNYRYSIREYEYFYSSSSCDYMNFESLGFSIGYKF